MSPSSRHIEIVCSSRELFGADRSALRLANVLRDNGHYVRLVLPSQRPDHGLDAAIAAEGHDVVIRPVPLASSSGVESAGRLLGRRGAETDGWSADVTILNTSAVLPPVRSKSRNVLMLREWLDPRSIRHRALAAYARPHLKAVVGVSLGVVEQWRRCVRGPGHQFVVNNWLDADLARAAAVRAFDTLDSKVGLLCLGRFNAWKGQSTLADAYSRAFRGCGDPPPLKFVGAQPNDAVFARHSDELTDRSRGRWTVEQFVADPADHLAAAAALVVPSMHPEPFGMVILEALSYGCRVIAFPGGGPDDLALPFAHALTVTPRSERLLSAALLNWTARGGRGQTEPEVELSHRLVTERWSPASASTAWERVIHAVCA